MKKKKPKISKEQRLINAGVKRETGKILDTLFAVPVYVLHQQFGFGAKRMERFIREYQRIYTAIINKEVTLNTIEESIAAEIGLRYDTETSNWYYE